ncbi:MAG: HdeA/HdeB family chaperone [Stellaceae bacterium]
MRYKGALLAGALIAAGTPAAAQQILMLTPTADTCRAFTAAMVSSDKTALTALAGWVVGYLSGVAEATRTDFLYNQDVARISNRLYNECLKRPEMRLSIAAQELARKLIAEHRAH